MPSFVSSAIPKEKQVSRAFFAAFIFDTVIVYVFALHISGMLVPRWFALVAPLLHIPVHGRPPDWFLQHLEWATIIPALVAGYINVGRFVPALVGRPVNEGRSASAAMWAWVVPTLVITWGVLQYYAPSSVLFDTSSSAIKYFFEIQHLYVGDPIRRVAQVTATAPFYAGIAYSLGAFLSKYRTVARFFSLNNRGKYLKARRTSKLHRHPHLPRRIEERNLHNLRGHFLPNGLNRDFHLQPCI
jgi:hypothetical protein